MIKFGNSKKQNPEWYVTKVTGDTLTADEWNLHVTHQRGHAVEHEKGGIQELGLDATQIVSGVLDVLRIPDLDAGKIVSGIFDVARIPDLDAGKIVSGIFDVARIPDLDAGKITTGIFSLDRIPTIPYTKTDFADQDLRKSAKPTFVGINLDEAILKTLTVDPALLTGKIWFRSDLGLLSYSPDGTTVRRIPYGTINVDDHSARHDYGGADPISALDTSQITSGRFPMTRMPDGDAGLVLTAQGLGVDPVYAEPPVATHDRTKHISPTLPTDDVHITSIPIDHPDESVTRSKLEYATEDVSFAYLQGINKIALVGRRLGRAQTPVIGTVDTFTDKAIECLSVDESGVFGRFVDDNDFYWLFIWIAGATKDLRLDLMVAGTETILGTEAVDLPTNSIMNIKLSILGITLDCYREDMVTPKFSVDNTAHASGKFCTLWTGLKHTQPFVHTWLRAPSSPKPKVVGYFEVPIIGKGTFEDPYHATTPELIEVPSVSELDGYDEFLRSAIKGNPENKVNRVSLTQCSHIPTDPVTGKPKVKKAIVEIFDQPDRQAHLYPIDEAMLEYEKIKGVAKLDETQAKKRISEIEK